MIFPAVLLVLMALPGALKAQSANRLPPSFDNSRTVALPNHHPLWANAVNSISTVPANISLNQFTLVLSRSAEQEHAFEHFLADQQNPASPDYHHWLTPEEVGARFGVSDADMALLEGWLQSQGLHVDWISPSRIFIGFGGNAANVNRAFGTELRYYNVNGDRRMSVASDPLIPLALAPVIKAVRGLYAIDDQPAVRLTVKQSAAPELSLSSGTHYVAPKDFNTIYDVPAAYTGAGVTVGIVSWSRTNFADFDNFRMRTGTSFANPTEIVPTAFGGIDPGPAYTTQQSCNSCLGSQMEATLDVERVGSTAQGASILLLVSSSVGSGGGIGADAQYLVNTSPVPVQVMNISFGGCELNAGPSGVAYWNTIFQQAVAEGISVFVSSGDSGASGCDNSFSPPPSSPLANSPNYICSSSYATCLGGTQFNDTSSPSTYWNASNSSGFASAVSYIPEGGWNESSISIVAASGGGVSTVVPTPSWQVGTGVPSARAGRYTPDISFTAAGHDGYFGCMAASGGSCAGGQFSFVAFEGTSATAPSMAGIAALLDQELGSAQGNLNPGIYGLAVSSPAAFHDATVFSSGVASCSLNTASMCNNSVPSPRSQSGGQAGYPVGVGYDEVTGLGSLDVAAFLNSFAQATRLTPIVMVTPSLASITMAQALSVGVVVSGGGNPTPTGSVVLSSGNYSSLAATLNGGSATISIPAGLLATGTDVLTVTYTPDSSSSGIYNSAAGSGTVTVTALPVPGFAVSGTPITIMAGTSAGNTSTITVTPVNGFTGSVALTATIISNLQGTTNVPTLSFGTTTPVNISGANAGMATLTVSTIASQQGACIAVNQTPPGINWFSGSGAVLACVLLFGFGPRRRRFRPALGMLALLIAIAGGVVACGGAPKVACTNTTVAGTAAGSYTITVTGTSGSTTASSTVTLTVQ